MPRTIFNYIGSVLINLQVHILRTKYLPPIPFKNSVCYLKPKN